MPPVAPVTSAQRFEFRRSDERRNRLALRTPVAPRLAPCARLCVGPSPLGRAAGPFEAPRTPSLSFRRPGRLSRLAVGAADVSGISSAPLFRPLRGAKAAWVEGGAIWGTWRPLAVSSATCTFCSAVCAKRRNRLPLRPSVARRLAPCFDLCAARRPLGSKAGLSDAPQAPSLSLRRPGSSLRSTGVVFPVCIAPAFNLPLRVPARRYAVVVAVASACSCSSAACSCASAASAASASASRTVMLRKWRATSERSTMPTRIPSSSTTGTFFR